MYDNRLFVGCQIICMGDAVSTQVKCDSQQRTEVTAKDSLHQRHISCDVVHFAIPGV